MRRLVLQLLRAVQRALPPSLRTWVARQRRRQLHVVVSTAHGESAFGIFGDDRWESRFSTLYLNASAEASVHRRFATHVSGVTRAAIAQCRRSGLSVLDHRPTDTPANLLLLRVPTFVAMRVDLLESPEAMRQHFNRSARNDLKRLATRDYRFDIVRDAEWAPEFHARYHRPSIAGRHGDDGFVMTAERMAQRVRSHGAEFVRAWVDGRIVGALLNEREGADYHLGRIGWLDGDSKWTSYGVVSALDWHSLEHARAIGCRHVQFGGTPPIVEHGVFRSKTKWRAQLDADATTWGDSWLLLDPSHRDVQRMCAAHSLVFRRDDASLAVLSGRTRAAVGPPPATSASIPVWVMLLPERVPGADAWARWCTQERSAD